MPTNFKYRLSCSTPKYLINYYYPLCRHSRPAARRVRLSDLLCKGTSCRFDVVVVLVVVVLVVVVLVVVLVVVVHLQMRWQCPITYGSTKKQRCIVVWL